MKLFRATWYTIKHRQLNLWMFDGGLTSHEPGTLYRTLDQANAALQAHAQVKQDWDVVCVRVAELTNEQAAIYARMN